MLKVVVAGFKHETNTFSNQPADFGSFRKREYVVGDDIIQYFSGTGTELGGFFNVLLGQPDIELIPVVAANAIPSAPVTRDVFDDVLSRVLLAIKEAGKVDGVLLSLHGAMVTETSEDGEGEFLEAIRQAVVHEVPVIATLDLHANMTEKMQQNATAFFHYDYYPHTDMYERGLEAATVMLATLRGKIKPVMRYSKLPLLVAAIGTDGGAMKDLLGLVHEYEATPGVISVSISHGFCCADITELGMSVVAVTDNNEELAEMIADNVAKEIWSRRSELVRKLYTAENAVREAMGENVGPVVLSDGADNPGGGSTCDGTHLLREMLRQGISNAAYAMIYDPQTVMMAERAGVGNEVSVQLGGKVRPEILGEPIECVAYVRLLSDGKYVNKGPLSTGLTVDLMKSAVLVVEGVEVIVTSNTTQPWDMQIFRSHGINPEDKKVLAVKSTMHFRADFAPVATRIIDVECPGLFPQDVTTLDYKNCRRPMYPLDLIE